MVDAVARSERALSESRFRAIAEQSSDLMMIAAGDRVVQWANAAFERVLGYPPESLVGKDIFPLFHSDDVAALAATIGRLREVPGAVGAVEVRIRAADGSWHWMKITGKNLLDDPAVQGFVVSMTDVTDRRQAEAELRMSEARYSDLFEGARDVVYTMDLDGNFTSVNPAMELLTGYSRAEVLTMNFMQLIAPEDLERVQEDMARRLAGGADDPIEVQAIAKDGRRLFMEATLKRVDPASGPSRLEGIVRDTTERHALEESERAAERRLFEVLETMSDAFFTLNRDWIYTYINAEGARLVRHTRAELIGRKILDVFPEAAESAFYTAYERCFRDRVTVEVDERYEPLDTWFSARVFPTPDGLAVFYRDVTDQKRLEAQLLQAQKLEAVGQLASGIAHDFNNLLTVIKGYSSLAQAEIHADLPSVERALEEITKASASATALTTKLLSFSRNQPLLTTVAEVNEIVTGALDLVDPLFGSNIVVHRQLDPDTGQVLVDSTQIQQVLINLAVNAKHAMDGGGNIYVTTKDVELDADTILGLEPGNYVCVTFRDDGCGMDEQTLERAFDPFFTTKPVHQGTGLGLSTAYGTITQSGGHISATSTPGEGTTFTIHLPRVQTPATAPGPAAAGAPPPAAVGDAEADAGDSP